MQINVARQKTSRCICEVKCENDIPLQLKALGKGLISLNQRGAVWSISKKMKMTPMTMTILITSVAVAAVSGDRLDRRRVSWPGALPIPARDSANGTIVCAKWLFRLVIAQTPRQKAHRTACLAPAPISTCDNPMFDEDQ